MKKKPSYDGKKAMGGTSRNPKNWKKSDTELLGRSPDTGNGTPRTPGTGNGTPGDITKTPGTAPRPNRYAFKTYSGTADDEGKMLRQAITSILAPTHNKRDQHKFGRAWMSSGLTNKIHLRLQNEERTTRDLRTDLERIASEQHVQRSRDNPSTLRFSHDFLDKYDTSQDISTSSHNLLEIDDTTPDSPNLLETPDNSPEDNQTMEIKEKSPSDSEATGHPKEDGHRKRTEFTLTPTINNLTNDQHLSNETKEETKETELDYEAFVDELDNESQGTIDSLDNNSHIPTGPTEDSFQTATGDLHKTNRTIQHLQMEHDIKEMVATILNDAKETTIRNAIQQEVARALHDEELDIQQSQISITLGQQITMAASMEELLLKRMEKTKTEYKLLKQHQKELAETNDNLVQEIVQASDSLAQIKEEEQQIWKQHAQRVTDIDKAHRAAFDDMLEQAQTHSLATFEAKYQKGLERIRKTETITYRKSLSSTTDEYRKRLDASFDKHRIAMNQKSNDMETLANDLVENAPFEADKEISYVVNDAIREVTESITNIKEQSIAEWTSSTIPAKSLTPQIKQAVDYAMTQRQHEVVRLDEHILQRQMTIKELETTITQQQQGLTTFLQNSQHTFETTIQDIIERETGNNEGSTLNDLLTRETTSAVEQMVKIREDLKTTIDTHFLAKEKELTERMHAFESTQQNARHDDRNRTLNDAHVRPEYDANNLNHNPRTYSTPVQSEHHETNETPLEEEERKLPWNHTARTMRTSIQVMSNIHRFKREVIQHNLTADPRQDQLENF